MEVMTNDDYGLRHLNQRAAKDADQAEIEAIKLGKSVFESGLYDEVIADALDDYKYPDEISAPADWQRRDLEIDTAVGKVNEEVKRRKELLGDNYPFKIEDNNIEYIGSKNKFYEFCLTTSLHSDLDIDFTKHARLFERIVTILIKEYLGENAKALHVGSPRDKSAGTKFKEAMVKLHELTGEWHWQPQVGLPDEPQIKDIKDGGIDFVAWIPTPDKRAGHLFLLGQCACGGNWESKFEDINIGIIKRWFNPMTLTKPVKAFTTPHHVTSPLLTEATQKAGQFFDRVRLTIIANSTTLDSNYSDELNAILDEFEK